MKQRLTIFLFGLAGAMPVPALAHGFLVSVRGDGTAVTGRVYYSDGAPGAREFVELRDLTDRAQPVRSATTGPDGGFRFEGVEGHRYSVVAHGEEGHTTEMQVGLADGARGTLVDEAAPSTASSLPPAWAMIGGALLLSIVPALWLRRRNGIKNG